MVNRKGKISGIRSRHVGIPMLLCVYYATGDGIKTSFWVDVFFIRFGRRPWGRKKNDEFFLRVLWPFWVLVVMATLLLGLGVIL